MNKTLLYTVQRVCEKLDLDPVNSIDDSTDAILIAREAETTLFDLIGRADWPDKYDLLELESVSDTNNPTALTLADEVFKIDSLRYDVTGNDSASKHIRKLEELHPEHFLNRVHQRNTSDENVIEVDYKGHTLFIRNDQAPTYFATFDNQMIILDSYDADVESTVQGSKTTCRGMVYPNWLGTDEYVIPVQDSLYGLYLSELTAACSIYLTGVHSYTDESRAFKTQSRMRRESQRTTLEYHPKNNFGRLGNGRR